MKHLPSRIAGTGAFTLIELMVSTAAVGITGLVLYYVLFVGMTLFAKNTAINMAHQEARAAVLQMEYDIHSAVSTPELTDVNRNPVAGNGPSAGISFQLFSAGPFQVTPSSTGYAVGQNQIGIRVNGYTPVAGQRLIIPGYQVELDISTVGAGSTDRILTLSANLPEAVTPTLSGQAINIPCFITDRVAYVVNGTQLLLLRAPEQQHLQGDGQLHYLVHAVQRSRDRAGRPIQPLCRRHQFDHRGQFAFEHELPGGQYVSQRDGALSLAALYLPVIKTLR